MPDKLILWNIYEVSSSETSLNGVMLRGRIRKLGLLKNFNILVENTEDQQNRVRFAVINIRDKETVVEYLNRIIENVVITEVLVNCPNPVLSKLKVNVESRYSL